MSGGRKVALALAWQNLRRNDVDELRERLAQSYQPATVNKMLAGVWETSFRKANLTSCFSCSFQGLPALPLYLMDDWARYLARGIRRPRQAQQRDLARGRPS